MSNQISMIVARKSIFLAFLLFGTLMLAANAVMSDGSDGLPSQTLPTATPAGITAVPSTPEPVLFGNFRVYHPSISGGINLADTGGEGGTILIDTLTGEYGWTVEQISLLNPHNALLQSDDANVDGRVLLIAGGETPLEDDEVEAIGAYLDSGGSMVIFAAINSQGELSLATADNLGDYLFEHYGLRFRNDIVYDLNNSVMQSPFDFIAAGFSAQQFITQDYTDNEEALLYTMPHSIEFAAEPANVEVTVIGKTTSAGFTKPPFDSEHQLTQEDLTPTEKDLQGEIPVAAVAVNTKTGSRIVLFGSTSIMQNAFNQLDSSGIRNTDAALRAVLWTAGYDTWSEAKTGQ